MTSTPDRADDRVRRMMASRTPLERLRMASRMFATAQALVKAGLPDSGEQSRTHLFRRLYGRDFSEQECQRIIAQFPE